MSLTIAEARDEIQTLFTEHWTANSGGVPLHYRDVKHDAPASGNWARATINHGFPGPPTLGMTIKERAGVFSVQIFTVFGDGLSSADTLVRVAMQALEGKSTPGGVWFRNVRPSEVGRDGIWFQTNVTADFEYHERT